MTKIHFWPLILEKFDFWGVETSKTAKLTLMKVFFPKKSEFSSFFEKIHFWYRIGALIRDPRPRGVPKYFLFVVFFPITLGGFNTYIYPLLGLKGFGRQTLLTRRAGGSKMARPQPKMAIFGQKSRFLAVKYWEKHFLTPKTFRNRSKLFLDGFWG